ncbi:MAG: hypothetical protein R2695_12605 [Acidimicrobiales bacterium]
MAGDAAAGGERPQELGLEIIETTDAFRDELHLAVGALRRTAARFERPGSAVTDPVAARPASTGLEPARCRPILGR